MICRLYYAWFDHKDQAFRLSLYPADAPVRPSIAFQTKAEVNALVERRKARVMWWPPLAGNEGKDDPEVREFSPS